MRIHGKSGTALRLVSCYRPVAAHSSPGSVWNQHRTFLQSVDIDGDPRDVFLADLAVAVAEWKASGDNIVLGIDLNGLVTSREATTTFRSMGLVEAISIKLMVSM